MLDFLLGAVLDHSGRVVIMNHLSEKKRRQVVLALVEGNSIRATVRLTGPSHNTFVRLIIELGSGCSTYMDRTLVNRRRMHRREEAVVTGNLDAMRTTPYVQGQNLTTRMQMRCFTRLTDETSEKIKNHIADPVWFPALEVDGIPGWLQKHA